MASTPDILQFCKLALRITSDAYDDEIETLIAAARLKMQVGGVLATKAADDTNALVRWAIATYVRANFGLDNQDSEKLGESFESYVTQLKGTQEYGKTYEG